MFEAFDEFLNLVMQASQQQQWDIRAVLWGHIQSYDPAAHAVKVRLPTFRTDETSPGIVTPWLQLGTPYAGDGYGLQCAPEPDASGPTSGTQCAVLLAERDSGAAVAGVLLFNDKAQPPFPNIQPGEVGLKAKGQSYMFFHVNSDVEINSFAGQLRLTQGPPDGLAGNITLYPDGTVRISNRGGGLVQIDNAGNIEITAPSVVSVNAPTIVLNGNVVSGGNP